MTGKQRMRVLLALIAAAVTIAGIVWAAQTIGGDSNDCGSHAVCGRGNDNNNNGGMPASKPRETGK